MARQEPMDGDREKLFSVDLVEKIVGEKCSGENMKTLAGSRKVGKLILSIA